MTRRTDHAVWRVARIAATAATALGRYERLRLADRLGRPAPATAWDRAHDRTAAALHDLGTDLAGLFVKVCQVVGARADVFPRPFVQRLGRFHDRVPPRPFETLRPAIERELGQPLAAVFAEVDPEPIAAASLAQVHRARLHDGSLVAVKVQYPEIARLARIDLASLRRALRVVVLVEPRFDLRSIAEEVARFVALELDFAREADATERVRAAFAGDPDVRIPRVYRAWSTEKLLVLEYLDGIRIADVDALHAAGVDLPSVARRVGELYARMIFQHAFFQADPHPGNLLVLPGGAIGLLDFGLAKELPAGFAAGIATMLVAALSGDGPRALAAARAIGFEVRGDDPSVLPGLVLALLGDREREASLEDVLTNSPVTRVPADFGLIARVMLLLNGLSFRLAPGRMLIQHALVQQLASHAADGAVRARADDGLPAGPRTPPLLQALRWVQWPVDLMEECAAEFGDCFTLRPPGSPPMVFFSHPDAIRDIFTGSEDTLHAGEANARFEPLLGRHSLLLLDGQSHLRERRLLQPPFHGERMHAYGDVMRDVAASAIARWPIGRPFPLHPEMQGITLDVILRTVFGLEEGAGMRALRVELLGLLTTIADPQRLIAAQMKAGAGGAGALVVRAGVDRLLFAEIARRRTAGDTDRADVLSVLLGARDEQGQPMTDEELRDELVTFLVAGHETTATALAWAFHHLLANPAELERVRHELCSGSDGGIRGDYIDAVVRESLRLTPIVPIVGRRLLTPLVIGGRALPAGVVAAPCIYLAHRRPQRWPQPAQFRPERFLGARPTPYEFLPFGGGVRRCLGMAFALFEMKIVLAEVLTRLELEPATGYQVRVVRRAVTLAPSEGMPVVASRRAA